MLVMLFLILLHSSELNGQPCEDKNSVELSGGELLNDGTIVKNGVAFPPKYIYTKNFTGEIKTLGCVCKIKNCFRKCCSMGSVMYNKTCTEMSDMDIILNDGLDVYFMNAFQRRVRLHTTQDLSIVYGRPCQRVYLEDDGHWFLQKNGKLFKFEMFYLLIVVLAAVLLFYLNGKYNENYWKKRGVVFHPQNKTCGIHWDFITTDQAFFQIVGNLYRKYRNEPVVAIGSISRPSILVRDLTNVEHILQADFNSFSQGGMDTPEYDKLANSILFIQGKKWKVVRQSMSPLFTAAKLKNMFYIIEKSAQDFIQILNEYPEKLKENTFDNLTYFTCASIAAAVFGIGSESVFDSPFLKMSRKALEPSLWMNVKFTLLAVLPGLYKMLKMKIFGVHEKPFIDAISQVIEQRKQEKVRKHDFVDLCVALQKNGVLKDSETQFEIEPTDELLAAQAFFYFVAGVEPCATAIFSTIMELGRNAIILNIVHKEIDDVFKKTNGKLSYEIITELKYLEKVINEGLRMYPPAGTTARRCVKDAVLPIGNIKIDKGTHIIIPLFEIQRDPKYFPDPDTFNPDRFDTEANEKPFMPFSKGNRMCIGARFAKLLVKTGLVHILRHYTPETTICGSEIKFKKQPFQVTPENVEVKLIPRNIRVSCA